MMCRKHPDGPSPTARGRGFLLRLHVLGVPGGDVLRRIAEPQHLLDLLRGERSLRLRADRVEHTLIHVIFTAVLALRIRRLGVRVPSGAQDQQAVELWKRRSTA
jgi:hypothetical protein